MKPEYSIEVYFQDARCPHAIHMGTLSSSFLRGKEVFCFEHHPSWLAQPIARQLDPDLGHFLGKQYLNTSKSQFGLFLDSSPDRWGRMLMQRREAIQARNKERPVRKLSEMDYLLGVFDENRMGAIRFKRPNEKKFLDNQADLAAPPWTQIRQLEAASWMLESEQADQNQHYAKWVRQLTAPGSSLGGARPKASVTDENGALWIAKFPSRQDEVDRAAWEILTYKLACLCGIEMAASQAQRFGLAQHCFLSKRFDRTSTGQRVHFSSAMTQLGYSDGQNSQDGVSYLELAEWLQGNSHQPTKDLHQLWCRIVFSIAVSNCDDHLRNHGFLLTKHGWELSPAYDINPDEFGTGLKLNISEDDNSLSMELALSVASFFGISATQGKAIVTTVLKQVAQWPQLASELGISRSEQELMSPAFSPPL